MKTEPKQIFTVNGERYIIDESGHQLIPLVEENIWHKINTTGKYLSCNDVAERYGVKKITVWSWIRGKKLNAIQTGKIYRIRPEDLKEFEDARRTNK